MIIGDALSRLSAGLDRDEQLARAATDLPKPITKWPEKRPPWEPERWAVDRGDLKSANGVADPIHDLEGGARSEAVVEHMARHDPARVLEQYVPAIRKVIARHEEAERDSVLSDRDAGFEAGLYAALECLASIYPDESEDHT